ncbi:MAG: ribosomal-processing cysteine protease Prp [Oscillospiraceae bacterium]|jgi:uncharacterized protein YsxB (DUF464 family)|nr:ribosomal-processing cysteine protease Prp [Oscillospiraceae bacterium]
MITVQLKKIAGELRQLRVFGHANQGTYGKDIVCAGVSSAVQMLINGITEILKLRCELEKNNNEVRLAITDTSASNLQAGLLFMEAFFLHISILGKENSNAITVEVMEVL